MPGGRGAYISDLYVSINFHFPDGKRQDLSLFLRYHHLFAYWSANAGMSMTSYDDIAEKNNDEERLAFIKKLIAAIDEIGDFVGRRLWGEAGTYGGFLKGSFNIGVIVNHGNRGSAVIRFPTPGRTYEPWRAEKVRNEVMVIEYLREHTTIPLPNIRFWGLGEESPGGLGPFIVMDFVNGTDLDELLKQPTEDNHQDIILDPDIDEAKLDIIYDQVADYMLQLSRLTFPRIGAVSKDSEWMGDCWQTLDLQHERLGNEHRLPSRSIPYHAIQPRERILHGNRKRTHDAFQDPKEPRY